MKSPTTSWTNSAGTPKKLHQSVELIEFQWILLKLVFEESIYYATFGVQYAQLMKELMKNQRFIFSSSRTRSSLTVATTLVMTLLSTLSFGQLTGVKTIPGDYATVQAAVVDLNAQGVGAGGVIFNVAAGHTETLTGRIVMTATGTLANPITFQKSGVGANPVLNAYVGIEAVPSVLADGFWVLAGSDYVTIDGINLQESAANTTTTTVMEFGFGLFKASDANGCQNNTIRNCVITLDRLQNTAWTAPGHNGSVGIAILNGLYTATGAVTVTAVSGSNSFNKFYSNTIQNCNAGISFIGFAATTPYDLGDTNNDVGGTSLLTGNTVLNFGGGAGATNPATGIFASSQWGYNVSYNTINNNNGSGANHVTTMRGIFMNASSPSASASCTFNTITLTGGAATNDLTFIENGFGAGPIGNTINISNNTLTGSYPTATTGAFRGIYNNTATPATLNVQNNVISNLSYSNAANTGTGTLYPIHISGSSALTTINATGNSISNISRVGTTGGTTIGIFVASSIGGLTVNATNNTVQNMSISGAGTASTMYGIQTSTGTIACNNNTVDGLTCVKTTGTGALYGIYNIASPTNETYDGNTIRNITHNGTGTTYGLFASTATGIRTVSNNLVHGVVGAGTTIAGINMASSSPTIFKNKIYNISSTSTGAPTVSGLIQGTLGTAGVANIYNNYIGDITAPSATSASAIAPSVRGINVLTATTTTSVNISYNTVHLNATSTGTAFATAGLFVTSNATATTANLTLQNNIIVNLSTPIGVGNTVAYQRSSNVLANYSNTSNRNLLYAGVPGAQNLVYYDGTTAEPSMSAFKILVSPREAQSVTENPSFLSTVGSNANYLHINPLVATQVESGAQNVVGITTDYDNNIRQGNGGYAGSGSAPDIGADEGDFIGADLTGPTITYTPISSTICITSSTISATIVDPSLVNTTPGTKPRIWFKKSTENNVLPATNTSADNGWKWAEASNSSSPFTFTLNYSLLNSPAANGDVIEYFVVAQDLSAAQNVGVNNATFANSAASVQLAANVFPITSPNSFTLIALPPSVNAVASTPSLCVTGNSTLSLSVANLGAEYQWQSSPAGAGTWLNIPSATAATYAATGINSSTDYRCEIYCASVPVPGISPTGVATVVVDNPQVLTTVPNSSCASSASVALGATANPGGVLNWYAAPTGGIPIGTGTTFNTPVISTTTTYYVAATSGLTIDSVGALSPTIGTISASNIAIGTQRMFFNVLVPTTILTIDIYPTAAIGSNGTIVIRNNTQTVIATVPYTTTVTGGAKQTVPVNVFLAPGTAYEIGQGTAITLNRNTTGAVYPYTSSAINITGNTFDPNYYYFYYNWKLSSGCESPLVPVTATINPSSAAGTDTRTECSPYTWIDGNVYTANNTTATFNILGGSASGCDSLVTLNLTIQNPALGTDVQSACGSYTWINGTTYTSSNSTATFTLAGAAANGCDSIVTLNLTILNPVNGTDVQSACGTYTWINGTTYTSSNNTATFTLAGGAANGCDSIVTLNLTILNPTTGIDVQTACDNYSWIDGNNYASSNNTATFTFPGGAANGCDSIVTLNLTINSVDASTTTSTFDITANESNAQYQWVDCDNNFAPIVGETGQTFTATANGNYAVIVTSSNGCEETSPCVAITTIGLLENTFGQALTLYPNPTTGNFTIDLGSEMDAVELTVLDLSGKVISSTRYTQTEAIHYHLNEPSGVYILEIKSADHKARVRLVKE